MPQIPLTAFYMSYGDEMFVNMLIDVFCQQKRKGVKAENVLHFH